MTHDTFWLTASDHSRLFVNLWLPERPLKALILLAHGMAEHSARYERLATALCAEGYGVYAPDLRGHGKTAEQGVLGHYADQDGWNKVVGDLASLQQHIGQLHPELPIILLGHSMGSYIAQAYLLHHSASLHGAILSGSNLPSRCCTAPLTPWLTARKTPRCGCRKPAWRAAKPAGWPRATAFRFMAPWATRGKSTCKCS